MELINNLRNFISKATSVEIIEAPLISFYEFESEKLLLLIFKFHHAVHKWIRFDLSFWANQLSSYFILGF